MTQLTLAKAQTIITAGLAHAREKSLAPMAIVVLDARGVLKAFAAEEGTALRRADIAIGKAYGALSMGVGYAESTQLGPMVNAAAVERIGKWVDEARAGGAKVLIGGKADDRPGYYYPATVITDVPADARLVNDEIFGPVAPITVFDSADEAVAAANDTEYGLIAYVYTEDLKQGLRVAERIEAGMVGLNRGLVSDPAAPFGGVKQSGLGREGAHHGIMEFLEVKYIAASW